MKSYIWRDGNIVHFKGDKKTFDEITEIAKSVDENCKVEWMPDIGFTIDSIELSEEATWEFFRKVGEYPNHTKAVKSDEQKEVDSELSTDV